MRKLIATLVLAWLCVTTRSQLLIQPGAGFKTTGDVQLTLDGGSITNNDTSADFSACILQFRNTGNARLGGFGNWIIKTLVLNKGAYQLKLGAAVRVKHELQLAGGKLDLNNQILTLDAGATIQGESAANRIIGPTGGIIQTTVSLNAPQTINPGNIGAVITSSANLGQVTVKRWHNPDGFSAGKIQRFYEITPAQNTSLNATLSLHYFEEELNNVGENALELFTRSNSQQSWMLMPNSTKNSAANYVEKSGLATLQQFSTGANDAAALPLTWGSVRADCRKGNIEVQWTSLIEQNITRFIVQRNANGFSWEDIGTVYPGGTGSGSKTYSYTDVSAPISMTLSYRVVAVENGDYSYSGIASARPCKKNANLQLVPVPATTNTTLVVYAAESFGAGMRLYGADGKLYQQRSLVVNAGPNRFPIDVSRLPAGTYHVQVDLPGGLRETLPLIKK